MTRSIYQSIDERENARNNGLFFPGGPEGFPFRGDAPASMKDSEFEQLQVVAVPRNATFWLDIPEDAAKYEEIMAMILNNRWAKLDRDRRWSDERKCYVIYLEWAELFSQKPSGDKVPFQPQGSTNGNYRQLPNVLEDIFSVPRQTR